MALTFDDGPSAYTSAVLATLNRYGVHATFFEVGDEVAAAGISLAGGAGVRGRDRRPHLEPSGADRRQHALADVQRQGRDRGCDRLQRRVSPSALRGGSPVVVATVTLAGDAHDPVGHRPPRLVAAGPAAIARNVLSNAHNGAIAIMHDGGGNRSQTVTALNTIIPTLLSRGYKLVTVPQLLGLSTAYTYTR